MSVLELERTITPLTRAEKEELFRFLAEELNKEHAFDNEALPEQSQPDNETSIFLKQAFPPGLHHAVLSVFDEYKAAEQLQKLLDQHHL